MLSKLSHREMLCSFDLLHVPVWHVITWCLICPFEILFQTCAVHAYCPDAAGGSINTLLGVHHMAKKSEGCVCAYATEAAIASVIAPAAREVQPPPSHPKPEQAYYKPPSDRHTVAPPRGADVSSVIPASQQPLPRGDSDNTWGSEASLAAAHAPSRASGQVPFVQQQQNKQQPAASHAQKPQSSRAPAQQAQQRAQHAGQAASVREAARPEPTPAPAPEAASGWTCPTCTYRHEGKQAGFLACAMCGGVRKET